MALAGTEMSATKIAAVYSAATEIAQAFAKLLIRQIIIIILCKINGNLLMAWSPNQDSPKVSKYGNSIRWIF